MYSYTQAIGYFPGYGDAPVPAEPMACQNAGGTWDFVGNTCVLPSQPTPPGDPLACARTSDCQPLERCTDGKCTSLLPNDPALDEWLKWRARAYWVIRPAAVVNGLYHGYKRNESVGWALAWGFFATCLPVTSLVFSVAMKPGWTKKKPGR